MTEQTRFIASNSKLFAAIAILQLREAGKLRLDDPVAMNLPWFTMKPAGPDDGPITIEQLLSHSSGLQREAGDHWSSFDFPTEAELQKLTPDRQAAFPPQTRWKDSNLAYAVAGLVVKKITGQRWADYVQAHIITPLGMTATSIDKPDPGLATPYASRTPEGTRRILPFVDARGMPAATGGGLLTAFENTPVEKALRDMVQQAAQHIASKTQTEQFFRYDNPTTPPLRTKSLRMTCHCHNGDLCFMDLIANNKPLHGQH